MLRERVSWSRDWAEVAGSAGNPSKSQRAAAKALREVSPAPPPRLTSSDLAPISADDAGFLALARATFQAFELHKHHQRAGREFLAEPATSAQSRLQETRSRSKSPPREAPKQPPRARSPPPKRSFADRITWPAPAPAATSPDPLHHSRQPLAERISFPAHHRAARTLEQRIDAHHRNDVRSPSPATESAPGPRRKRRRQGRRPN